MKARLIKAWEVVRASYWFVPTLMAFGAVVLSFVTLYVDNTFGAEWLRDSDWFGRLGFRLNQPDGARALLSTIAGSMIGVAGVTFSITIAAVSYATGQFGPRLLTNFMRDRGNQFTLGTFIATFLYCLLVLRTIRSPEEVPRGMPLPEGGAESLAAGFVPHIAVLVGVFFALASIGVLIYFIHHIPESIHASNVVAGVGEELNNVIGQLFPEKIGYEVPSEENYDPERALPEDFLEEAVPVPAGSSGYVQYIDERRLMTSAIEHDLLLRVQYRPGDFVIRGCPLVLAWPAEHVSEHVSDSLSGAFIWGRQRTQRQDAAFLARELVEIAGRALSPGTNDPFTAMSCMDWLSSALANLAQREMPGAYRYDAEQTLRIVAQPATFALFCREVFPQLRPYAQGDRNAALHLMQTIAEVGRAAQNDDQRQTLLHHAEELHTGAREALPHPADRETMEQRYRVTARLLQGDTSPRTAAAQHDWLGGSS